MKKKVSKFHNDMFEKNDFTTTSSRGLPRSKNASEQKRVKKW